VRLDKGVFSSNVIFKALGLLSSGRRAKLDKMMEVYGDTSGLADEEGIITAIPKNKAEDLLEVIRNGMDRDREVYRHREQPQQQQQQQQQLPLKAMAQVPTSEEAKVLLDDTILA
jgi:hypothetical protein